MICFEFEKKFEFHLPSSLHENKKYHTSSPRVRQVSEHNQFNRW